MFNERQLERYARHILLREVGGPGQQKLLDSKVLIVGAGGLGSPLMLYLAAAGVGTIGVVDDDAVALSNLQRQIAHTEARIGHPKTESAAETVARINPEVSVERHQVRLDPDNAMDLIGRYDLVADGSDNFGTRFLINDACYLSRTPWSRPRSCVSTASSRPSRPTSAATTPAIAASSPRRRRRG